MDENKVKLFDNVNDGFQEMRDKIGCEARLCVWMTCKGKSLYAIRAWVNNQLSAWYCEDGMFH